MIDLSRLRREFMLKTLEEADVAPNPIDQFEEWFQEALDAGALEPNAMVLATVGINMKPSCRVLLLKKIKPEGFVFFTNYDSRKGGQISENPYCAIIFMWHELERQVRIEGQIMKLSAKESDEYFEVRPPASKLGAWASPQSSVIPNRAYLESLVAVFDERFKGQRIERPENWGGYIVKPSLLEFWQGRESRLHDRIQYRSEGDKWTVERLAP